MSNEIKDDDDIHTEVNHHEHDEEKQEIVEVQEPLPTLETTTDENPIQEDIISSTSNNDQEEIEPSPSVSTDNTDEAPSIPIPLADVIIEKEDEPLSAPASDDNIETHSPAEETLTPVISVQSEETSRGNDTHQLLQLIANKSNREASSAILNTVRN